VIAEVKVVPESPESPSDSRRRAFYDDRHGRNIGAAPGDKYHLALELFRANRVATVLDVGCGDGSFVQLCVRSGLKCIGVELSPVAVQAAGSSGVDVRQADIETRGLPFPNDTFDAVYCGELIEHVTDTDRLLDECARVVRQNGLLVITTPNLASWVNRALLLLGYQPLNTEVSLHFPAGHPIRYWLKAGHLRLFTLRALLDLANVHNLKVVELRGFGVNLRAGLARRHTWLFSITNRIFSRPSLAISLFVAFRRGGDYRSTAEIEPPPPTLE
jgi:methionine biosynthesis protein MetW